MQTDDTNESQDFRTLLEETPDDPTPTPPTRPEPGSDGYFATLGELRAACADISERITRVESHQGWCACDGDVKAAVLWLAQKMGCADELSAHLKLRG